QVARVPCLAESGRAQVPVRTDLPRHLAQVASEVFDRRAAPEPVAVVDDVDDEPRLEHERVRDHRVVLRVVYSWISRSRWIVRSRSERNVHWAPTDARNCWSVWWSSVETVTICVYATATCG